MVKQDMAAQEATTNFILGTTEWGKTKTAGFADGYIDFIQDDPLYTQYVPEEVRTKLEALVAGYKSKSTVVPELN